ncbi:SIR2 family NAD-dependent protein deacylase [Paenibacillus sp. UASWS1643]|uniref:SIR2 family NAD-dependent protein deacylase n=1 Tax=Paenibacillus sp. UASWS1643 TaxID=2580422 RepID=UPI00123B63DF|nr:SIR2 family protein [Paenibacillus sp. UASWS1643]KAA8751508.1 SIR2 family protein [Paenibacillus sp. UASWS1643]
MTKDVEEFFQENLDMYPHFKKIRDRLWSDDGKSRVTVMVGAGFSLNAKKIEDSFNGMALWHDIKDELTKSLSHKGDLSNVDVLEIGQLYVKEYGRTSLDEALKNAIPDNNYEPDSLHFDLLKLPWSDIYTTNYDTLLERAKSHVHERNYQTIYDISDIPNSVQPRIIKLHGSFPANRPFIFTKSDYDNYPVKFSPFVNMVQQSIMETTFVLIGFSGDDPNFSNWTSWVSENLGEHMPKVYMLGYDQEHRGVELEKKGITLIDFTRLYSSSSNPFNDMYTDIFRFLMNESKKKKNEWPHRILDGSLNNFIYNRKNYPGWVVLPDSIRRSNALKLHNLSNHFFSNFNEDNISQKKINLINEFLWYFNIFSIPLDFNKHRILESIIGNFVSSNDSDINLNEIKLVLLREARLDFDQGKFNQYFDILKDSKLNSEQRHLLQYETILNLLALNKVSEVLIELNNWQVTDNDYEWNIKKAVIYSNIKQLQVAENLLELSLLKIKKLLTIDNENYRLLSLESVVLHNLERITNKRGYYSKRLREINSHSCNSNSELERTWLSVKDYNYDLGNKETFGFDPRTRKSSSKFGDFMSQEILDSYAALILQEELGLYYIRKRFEIAHKNISIILPNFSLTKGLYYANNKDIGDIFTRQFVYYLKSPQLVIIESILINSLIESSPLVPVEHAIEILSRVYFAFSSEKQILFDEMIFELIENKKIYSISEVELYSNLIQRLTFSKTYHLKKTFFEKLLVALDNNFVENSLNYFFDPFLIFLSINDLTPIKLEIKEEIKSNLLENANEESALIRLVFLYQTQNLTTEQEHQLALIINSLPSNRSFGFSNFVFQSTFEFIFDSINLKQREPLLIIQDFIINKEIPKFTNNGVISDGSAFDNYFKEFSSIINKTLEKNKEIPMEILAEWLSKFFYWWDSQKAFLLGTENERNWLIRSPDYLILLVQYLSYTILKTIPLDYLDSKLKEKLSSLINEIYHCKIYCFVYLLPQAKRLHLDLNFTTSYADLIWKFPDDSIKHALRALPSYLELIIEGHIDEEPTTLLNQLFEILKYGSHTMKLAACDAILQTIKSKPLIFSKEDCVFLIEFSNNNIDFIIENDDLILSQDEFELHASISSLVTQLIIMKSEDVGTELDHWKEIIKNHRLPEIRINSDHFIKTS